MKQRNQKLVKGLSVAMLLMGSNLALAETLSVPATVTVDNAIDFTVTGTLDFGTVRAGAGIVAECAIIVLAAGAAAPAVTAGPTTGATDLAACTVATNIAALQSVGGTLARPVFALAGIAPFTNLDLVLPSAAVALTGAGLPPGSSRFLLGNFTAYQTAGGSTGAITNVTGVTVNGAGIAQFNVGAQLATDPVVVSGIGVPYQNDVVYSGSFDVTVNY